MRIGGVMLGIMNRLPVWAELTPQRLLSIIDVIRCVYSTQISMLTY